MVFLGPVSSHHTSEFTPKRSAYFFNWATESLSGSTLNDRNCTKDVSTRLVTSFILSASCRPFIFFVRKGQIEGQWVKKKSATTIFPRRSFNETVSPNWFFSVILAAWCQIVSVTSFPFFTESMVSSK